MKIPTGWETIDKFIRREFKFESYSDVIKFVNQVARIAEREDHHPDMEVFYNKVVVKFTTHSAGGITEKDCKAAEEINWI